MLSLESTIAKPCCESPTPFFPFPSSSPCPSRRYSSFVRGWTTITSNFSEYVRHQSKGPPLSSPTLTRSRHSMCALLCFLKFGSHAKPIQNGRRQVPAIFQLPTPFFQHLMHLYFVVMARNAVVRFVCLFSLLFQHQIDALFRIGTNDHQIEWSMPLPSD